MSCIQQIVYTIRSHCLRCNKFNLTYRNKLFNIKHIIPRFLHNSDLSEKLETHEDDTYNEISNEQLSITINGHNVLIVQPYIKWGIDSKKLTTPQLQVQEAIALIKTLPQWNVVDAIYAPLYSFNSNTLAGSGKIEEIRNAIKSNPEITAVFISHQILKYRQLCALRDVLGLPVYDRYMIVIHILREHAQSAEAMLQVKLAEICYIRRQMVDTDIANNVAAISTEKRKLFIHNYEAKLQKKLEKLREHRQLLKRSRIKREIPSVAVVGYTNAGKTSLIKALTNDDRLQPRNQLFATLNTTVHEGELPCSLKLLYTDTIGFIQNVPHDILEPFKVTLQDALSADIIVHVYDISHPDMQAQFVHVVNTVLSLIDKDIPILHIGNKRDRVKERNIPESTFAVSSLTGAGIDKLKLKIQETLLQKTNRSLTRVRVRSGSPEASWLDENAVVINSEPDAKNLQYLYLNVLFTKLGLIKFKQFLKDSEK